MSDRRGFTLIELLVVAVLGAFVLVATYNVLITNQRTYTINSANIQGQQTVRAGMDLLFAELREISPGGGDILSMDSDELEIRVMRSAALVCDTAWTAANSATLDVVSLGDTIEADDSLLVYIEHDPSTSDDDRWVDATLASNPGSTTCQSRPAQTLSLAKLGSWSGSFWDTDTPSVGALLRTWTVYTYGLDEVDGERYLVRDTPGGTAVPLVGPLAEDGLTFEYLDEDGNVTTDRDDVRQILVTLRTISEARDNQGDLIADSLTARIYTRN